MDCMVFSLILVQNILICLWQIKYVFSYVFVEAVFFVVRWGQTKSDSTALFLDVPRSSFIVSFHAFIANSFDLPL